MYYDGYNRVNHKSSSKLSIEHFADVGAAEHVNDIAGENMVNPLCHIQISFVYKS